MKTAADLRAEAQHLRDIARNMTDPKVLVEIHEMIKELERRARALGNGGLNAQAAYVCLPLHLNLFAFEFARHNAGTTNRI